MCLVDLIKWIACTYLVQVYDVTPFMDDHPGGDEVLLAATGKKLTSLSFTCVIIFTLLKVLNVIILQERMPATTSRM